MTGKPQQQTPNESFPAHLMRLTKETVPPMHRAGRPFVLGGLIATILGRKLFRPLGVLGAVLTCWCAWFFREPVRVAPRRPGVIAAAADGTVASVELASPPAELGLGDTPLLRVSVFLSIFDVHVQRSPVDAQITKIAYRPGAFVSADLDKASEDNERNSMVLRLDDDTEIAVVQIAGLIARRIVCQVAEGDRLRAGQTYGMIRFGSRVDTYLPADARVMVEVGQRTIGGETVLAEMTH